MFTDVYLDPTTWDLPDGASRLVAGPEATRQRIEIRLRTFYGEWVLDVTKGLPWAAWAQQVPFQPQAVSARIRAEIASTPGVLSIEAWDMTWDQRTATLTLTGRIRIEGVSQSLPVTVTIPSRGSNLSPMLILPLSLPMVA